MRRRRAVSAARYVKHPPIFQFSVAMRLAYRSVLAAQIAAGLSFKISLGGKAYDQIAILNQSPRALRYDGTATDGILGITR